jgi:predicted transcriptional regulator
MADRRTDNGRDDTRTAQRPGVPENGTPGILGSGDVQARGTDMMRRGADVSPPGSRERSESDVTGYSPDRDEEPSVRQGRFHRAAALRLAQPRTSTDMATGMGTGTGMGMSGMGVGAGLNARGALGRDDRGMSGRGEGGMLQGPYGRDDRDDRSAIGMGGGQMRMGEQDTRHSLEMRRDAGGENYRPWDRTGFGGEERQGQYGSQGQQRSDRYDPMLGMSQASPGRPGMGVNIGHSETYTARGSETEPSRSEHKGGLGGLLRRRWQREPLTAREIMTRGVKTVRRDSSLREVAQLMKDEDCGVVPIVDDRGTLVGIITDRDLVIRAFTGGKTPDQLRAGDVMTDDVECVHPDEDMGDIANRADYDEELQEALDRISSKRSFWSRLT